MSSLGYSEYAESGSGNGNSNGNTNANNSKMAAAGRRGNGGGLKNRTLKVPRGDDGTKNTLNMNSSGERGIINSASGVANENGTNNGFIQQAGNKVKQIKDYIENIHRKGGEDSDLDDDEIDVAASSILPEYPAQGMGIYASNTTNSAIIRGADNGAGSGPIPTMISSNNSIVRKTTQMNSLNPSSAYSSTLLEGTNPASLDGTNYGSAVNNMRLPNGENGRNSNPRGTGESQRSFSKDSSTSTYAKQYYEQFVPYAENLANQLASSGGGGGANASMSGTNVALLEKLNYIIHMLEDKKDEKTGHVIEELVLYCFLGIFIIFIVDTFTRAGTGQPRYKR